MSHYEERAFPVGKAKADLSTLKNQLARLKEDLARFIARKPDGAVIAPLRERIRELEAQIGQADQRARERQAARAAEAGEDGDANQAVSGRYPPRRR